MAGTLIWELAGFFASLFVAAVLLWFFFFFSFKLGRIREEHIFTISCIHLKEKWKQTSKWFKLYTYQRPLDMRYRNSAQSMLKNG